MVARPLHTAAPLPTPVPAAEPPVRIRPLGPPDAGLLDELLAAMSPKSRYQRYHGAKPRLSSRERAYLANADGRDHVALIALDRAGAPLAVARSVRLRARPAVAEIAAEVADPWQRRGLGTTLMTGLARRAAAAGVERFTATVLHESGLHRALLRRGWRIVATDGPATTLEADVWTLLRRR